MSKLANQHTSNSAILHAATLGLNRQRINWELEQEWTEIASGGNKPVEKLLHVLAARQLAEKAAFEPENLDSAEIPLAPKEKYPYVDTQGAHVIYQVIHAQSARLLEEALNLLVEKEMLLPPEYLPILLEVTAKLAVDKELLIRSCGKRLYWVASLRNEWQAHLPVSEASWKTGSLSERLQWFLIHRKKDQKASDTLWDEVRKTASSDELIAFTQALKSDLSEADEAKLEPLLDHRRKDVRLAAFPLLARLEQADLISRMKERATAYFRMEKGTLKIGLPEVPKAWERDGFADFSYAASGLGEKAGFLCHLLACIPPDYWEEEMKESPEKLIVKAINSQWKEAVVLGFILASIRHERENWAKALLKSIFENSFLLSVIKPNVRVELIRLIPLAEREKIYLNALKQSERFDALLVDFSLVLDHDEILSDKIAQAFYQKLRNTVIRRAERTDQRFRYLLYELPNVALRTPIHLYPQIAALFPFELLGDGSYRHYLEEMLQTLDFRYKMYKTFT